jgi:hypothetical protein
MERTSPDTGADTTMRRRGERRLAPLAHGEAARPLTPDAVRYAIAMAPGRLELMVATIQPRSQGRSGMAEANGGGMLFVASAGTPV